MESKKSIRLIFFLGNRPIANINFHFVAWQHRREEKSWRMKGKRENHLTLITQRKNCENSGERGSVKHTHCEMAIKLMKSGERKSEITSSLYLHPLMCIESGKLSIAKITMHTEGVKYAVGVFGWNIKWIVSSRCLVNSLIMFFQILARVRNTRGL